MSTLRWSHTATINQDNRLSLTQKFVYYTGTLTLISSFSSDFAIDVEWFVLTLHDAGMFQSRALDFFHNSVDIFI